MIQTIYGQEPESRRWWKWVRQERERGERLPFHRRFSPLLTTEAATIIAEGERPEEATAISLAEVPDEALTPHPLRVPWGYLGWFASALAWMESQVGPVQSWQELKSWSLSCVIRAETAQGTVYFKATNPHQALFANEPRVTQELAQRFPGRVPRPLAIDPDRRWMLLADFGPDLSTSKDEAVALQALADYAELQRGTVGAEAELLAMGCVDRRPPHLAREVARLLDEAAILATLTDHQREALLSVDWQARIAAYRHVPCALVHGDLHMGNVASGPAGLLYFDWTDASVALPWMDLLLPFWPGNADRAQEFLAAYGMPLPPWEEISPLIALHHAVSYRHIRDCTEPCVQSELGNMTTLFLQKAASPA